MDQSLSLRVLTFNLLHHAESWPRRAPLVESELCARAPDIALLQEVAWPDEQAHALAASLSAASGHDYAVHVTGLLRPDGWQEGLAILSRFPINDAGELEVGGFGTIAQRLRVDREGHLLDVYNTHLNPHSTDLRYRQASALLAWMEGYPGAAGTIMGGDLNVIPPSGTVALFTARLHSAYAAVHGREPDHTFPTPFREQVRQRIGSVAFDYLFVSAAFEVVDVVRAFEAHAAGDPALYPSDHYGLAAELTLTS